MNRAQSHFLDAAAVVLFVLAALNFCGAVSLSPPLNWPDPLLSLSNRWTLVLFGGAELAVSAVLLTGKSKWTKLVLLAWLMTNLVVYRIGLWRAGASNFGDCIGNYIEWFLVSPKIMSIVAEGLIGLMLVGSYTFLILNWLCERKVKIIKSIETGTPASSGQSAS